MLKLIKYLGAFLFVCLLVGASFYTAKYLLKNSDKVLEQSGEVVVEEKIKDKEYYLPLEERLHEATWLIWPHKYTYGIEYVEDIENIFLESVLALIKSENVNIIAYNEEEKERISKLLADNTVDMNKVLFVIAKTDDIFVRDAASFFVLDNEDEVSMLDFYFNAWGEKSLYKNDNELPKVLAKNKSYELTELENLSLEGGAIESDGNGTLMLTKSSLKNTFKNSELNIEDIEVYLKKYLGAKNIISLEGVQGSDISDAQIERLARFYDYKTILTYSKEDFLSLYQGLKEEDYNILLNSTNTSGDIYNILNIPLTKEKIFDTKASYLNFYVANKVVLVPIYNDENDENAVNLIKELYKDKEIITINAKALCKYDATLRSILLPEPAEAEG